MAIVRGMGAARRWAAVAALAVAACQDANQIEVLHDPPVAAPRVFTWKLIPETATMSDGAFATDREAWVVGPYGTILHTADGGAERSSWQVVETGTTSPLARIAAVATPGGSFALVTGAGLVLRYRSDPPGWERLDLSPVPDRRPSLHVADDGRVEAWLATLDGLAYASDARTGTFTRATVPPGATDVIFSDDGDSWTAAPDGAECVPYRRARGEVDWRPMPIPQPAQPVAPPRPRTVGARGRPVGATSFPAFSSVPACSGAELLVTLQRRKVWFIDDRKDEAVAEWDGKAWIRYPFSADLAMASAAPPSPGSVVDLISRITGPVEFVLAAQRTPPAISPYRLPADPEAALRKDAHNRALAAWAKARGVSFSAADLWMRDPQIWVAGRDGFAHSTDGGQTWTVAQPEAAKPAAASLRAGRGAPFGGGRPERALQWKIALDDRGARGWAVSDDGNVFRYDGAWHAQFTIETMQHALALSISDGGDAAWLLTRSHLYHLTTDGAQSAAAADRDAMEALLVCPDGRSGWVRYDGYHWYAYDGTAWTKVNARPQPACISPSCATALAQADPDTVVCAAGDQLWSLRQGQTADGEVWQFPVPGLDPAQSRAVQLRADSAALPGRLIAISQDGTLLRTEGHTDQPAIVDPGATADGSDVVLSWALSGTPDAEPTWTIERCQVIADGVCAPNGTQWVPDSDVRQATAGGRYLATVSPSKLRVEPDTRVQYRIRMTQGELRRKPVRIAEVTRGESLAQTAWGVVRPYAAGIALWFAGLFGLWLFAPYAVLRINDSTRAFTSEIPLLGNVIGAATGAILARKLVRTRRVVSSWTARALRPADAASSPAGFLAIDDARLRAVFHAMASCQAAWVALHIDRAVRTFEGSKFAIERRTSGETGATVLGPGGEQKLARGVGLEDMRSLVVPDARDPKLVLWIRGQGGVGKSHLACRIARWLFKQDLRPHPAIVVVIDGNAESQEALDAMIVRRLAALTQATDVDASLVGHLLASGRVVLLFDGLTERSPKTIDVVCEYLESPLAPALSICTARSAHGFTARRSVTIEPMLLAADELLPFLSSYRLALPPAQRPSEELLEPVRRAAKRIAEGERRTPLTPLLVTLLWDEAVAGGAFSSLAIEAFNGYVARALVPAGDAAEHAEQRRLALVRARVLGRLALGKNYRPGRWFTRESAVHALTEAGATSAEHDVVHDFVAAGLLEEDSGGGQLRFLVDPLSEYMCALWILYSFDGNDAGWEQYLATLDAMSPEARAGADGFLLALADGWAAYGSSLQLTRAPRVDDVRPAER